MNGHQQPNRLKHCLILALGLGMAQIAGAVGLGPIVGVNSHMGQPLSASIRVDNLSKEEAQSASVSLASAEEYRSRGIQRLPIHDQLRFKLVPAGGGYRIQVSSSKGIREPFINFLLTINAGGQKITREYALFLNPDPGGSGSASMPDPIIEPVEPPKQQASITNTAPPPQAGNNIAMGSGSNSLIGEARPSNIPPATTTQEGWGGNTSGNQAVANTGGGRYTVKSGDTLYRIAQSATPRGGDINAMMQAIQRANPHAFGNASMNSLKAGAVLTIPGSTMAAAAPTQAVAATETAPRNTRRNNRRNTPTAQPATPPAVETPTSAEIAANIPPVENTQTDPAMANMPPAGDEGVATVLTAEVGQEVSTGEGANPMLANVGGDPANMSEPLPSIGMDTTLSLEGMDGLQPDVIVQGEAPSADIAIVGDLPQPDAPLDMPPTADVTVQTVEPVAAEPVVAEPVSPPVNVTPVSSTSSDSGFELPFGLQLWHLLLAAGLLVTGILLALLMKARGGRKRRGEESFDNMSPADIDRMVAELEGDSSLQRSLSDQLHDLDELSYEALSQSQEQQAPQQPHHPPRKTQHALDEERERLKARMKELDALKELEEAQDDFEQLSQKAEQVPAFDLHLNSSESAAKTPEPAASSSLFDDWDFKEQEPTVQTSANESNVDDFFNVDERLEDVIQPPSAAERVTFSRSSAQSAPATATAEVDAEKVEAMEINLDLATSFIATGNASRARVWLEEVLLEGSPSQKALATQLLKKVDAAAK